MKMLWTALVVVCLIPFAATSEESVGLQVTARLACQNQQPSLVFSLQNLLDEAVAVRLDRLPWSRGKYGARVRLKLRDSTSKGALHFLIGRWRNSMAEFTQIQPREKVDGAIEVIEMFPDIDGYLTSKSVFLTWEYDYPHVGGRKTSMSSAGGLMLTKGLYTGVCTPH